MNRVIDRVVLALVCGCGAAASGPAPRLPWPDPAPSRFTLDNGATAILLPDPDADFATVLVRYRVGAIDDPPGADGMSDLASHVSYGMRGGRRTLWDELDRVAIAIDDLPGESTTELEATTTVGHLHEVLRLEAQRLDSNCALVKSGDFEYARDLVRDEVASAGWSVKRTLRHALVPDGDPGQRRYDATPEGVAALTEPKVCDFLASHYVPANLTLVVSGPVDAGTFGRLASETIGAVHARAAAPRPQLPAMTPATGSVTIAASVGTPAAMIAWPLPTDPAARARTTAAARVLAKLLDLEYLVEDRLVLVGDTEPRRRDRDDLIARVTAALAGNSIVRDELVHAIEARRALALARYDDPPSRVRAVADPDAGLELDSMTAMTPESWQHIAATDLAWSHAHMIIMQPDGRTSVAHALDLGEQAHPLRGRIARDAGDAGVTVRPSTVLAHARTVKLDDGLTVVLAPTTVAPVLDLELVFGAGYSDEDHPGTARVAIRALDAVAHRGAPAWAEADGSATAEPEWSAIHVFGAASHADLLLHHFAGLAAAGRATADELAAARLDIAEHDTPSKGQRYRWDHAVRAMLYGAEHPDAKPTAPTAAELASVDGDAVAAFTAKYLRPSNATLVVTGGFDAAEVEKLVRAAFAGWRDGGGAVQRAAVTVHGESAMLAIEDPSLELYVDVSWRAAPGDDELATRILIAAALQSHSARLDSGFERRRDGGRYRLAGAFPIEAGDAIAKLFHELPGVNADQHLSHEMFASDQRRIATSRVGGRRDADSWALTIAHAFTDGHDVAWLQAQPSRYTQVTYEHADELAARELTRDRMVWLIAGPHDAVAAVYAEMGVEPRWIKP